MAVVRRHWKLALSNCLLLCLTVGLLLWHSLKSAKSLAATSVGPGPSAVQIDPVTYSQIQQLRNETGLTTRDLAAMGCNAQGAQSILSRILTWYQQNQTALEQSDQAIVAAKSALADATRKISIGPRDNTLIAQMPTLKAAIATAMQQRQELVATLGTTIDAQLAPAQSAIRQTAVANSSLPEQFRYVPSLSGDEIKQLLKSSRLQRSSTKAAQIQQTIINATRQSAMTAAESSIESTMSQVTSAEQSSLPIPTQLVLVVPTTQRTLNAN